MNSSPQKSFYPSIEGLRGLAVLMILLYHLFYYVPVFRFCWISVDLFFLISGFLISGILLKHREEQDQLRVFYIRRALRILPMYYVMLVVMLFLLPPTVIGHFDIQYFRDNQLWLWFYAQNWLFVLKNPGHNVLLNHFWTLAVEEQFYIFWPFVTVLFRRSRQLLLFIGALMLFTLAWRIVAWRLQFHDIDYDNLYKFTRIDGIIVGSLLAVFYHYRLQIVEKYKYAIIIVMAALNLTFLLIKFTLYSKLPYYGFMGYTTISVGWGLLLHKSLDNSKDFIYKILTLRPLQALGKISYSLYLLHWPVYQFGQAFLYPLLERAGISGYTNSLVISTVCFASSIALGQVTYYFIERYFMGLKRYPFASYQSDKR